MDEEGLVYSSLFREAIEGMELKKPRLYIRWQNKNKKWCANQLASCSSYRKFNDADWVLNHPELFLEFIVREPLVCDSCPEQIFKPDCDPNFPCDYHMNKNTIEELIIKRYWEANKEAM